MRRPIANPSDFDARLARYRTAMANGRPDQIPIRPFVAEFTASFLTFAFLWHCVVSF
jgi:tRNA G10  N-methylase Trm11